MAENGSMPTLYTQPNCSPCEWAKQWLQERGIIVRVVDIRSDHQLYMEFKDTGSYATPTLIVGDKMLQGFNKQRWSLVLGVPV